MGNITVTKSSPADYIDNPQHDTRRENADSATDYRPATQAPRDWRVVAAHYAGAVIAFVIVALVYAIFRLAICYDSYSETCSTWRAMETYAPPVLFYGALLATAARGVAWCFRARNVIQQGRIENERFSLLPDRFGNPTPASLYDGMTPRERFESYYAMLRLATELKAQTAQYEVYPGSLNNLSIGGNTSNVQALPEATDSPIALVPDDKWRQWVKRFPHALVAGKTEAGKTTFMEMLLSEYIEDGNLILVLDPHWQPGKWFGLPAIGGIDPILQLLPDLNTELRDRLQAFQEGKQTEEFDRLVILIDEVPAIVSECIELTASGNPKIIDPRWSRFARNLGSEARKVGIRVILGSQSTLVKDLLINNLMIDNYTRIGLGNMARPLLASEKDSKRKQALYDLLRGQQYPAAIEYRGDYYALDTSNVPALAGRNMRPLARVWEGITSQPMRVAAQSVSGLSAELRATAKMPENGVSTRQTDDRQTKTWSHEKKIAVLHELRKAGLTRNEARNRLARIGQGFDNDDWTEARP